MMPLVDEHGTLLPTASANAIPVVDNTFVLRVAADDRIDAVRSGPDTLLGFLAAELVGMHLEELLHPDDMLAFRQHAHDETPRQHGQVRMFERTGAMTTLAIDRYPDTGTTQGSLLRFTIA